jgi:beta-aspartyl-peptidase (threonine type)
MKPFIIVIHGGAETINDCDMSKEKEAGYRKGLTEALQAGWEILASGGSALDAVEAAVKCMEDNELFNAGRGGSLTQRGETEFDASIIDGRTLKAGAISGVRYVKNPVGLARKVMEKCAHTFITGTGAEEFALKNNLAMADTDYFVIKEKQEAWLKKLENEFGLEGEHDTVGAVALDQDGNLAVATSTGGLTNQLKGRVGDSPIIGGGTFANNHVCAVSCTGDGEVIMRGILAHEVYALVKYAKKSIQEAGDETIKLHDDLLQGDKGLIGLDPQGNIAIAFNTNCMKRAYRKNYEEPVVKIWDSE